MKRAKRRGTEGSWERGDWDDVNRKAKPGGEMREWEAWRNPKAEMNLRGRGEGKLREGKVTVKEKRRREQQEEVWCVTEVFASWQASKSHHERKMYLKWHQIGAWERRTAGDVKNLEEKILKGHKSSAAKRLGSGNKHWCFKEWHCARGRFIWTQQQKCSERGKNICSNKCGTN